MHLTSSAALCALLTAAPLLAQTPCFETNLGTNLNLTDDSVATNRALGFSFPFGASTVTAVSVSSNGFVWLGNSTDSACCNGDVNAFLSGLARIAGLWTDLDPGSNGGVFFNTFPGRAVITWNQVPEYGVGVPFTFQIQLLSTGAVTMFWDGTVGVTGHTALVGITPGGGAANPGARDYSATLPFNTGTVATVFESFPANSFDLRGRVIDFTPNGQGGYAVTAHTGCQFASFQQYGLGCPAANRLALNSGSRPSLGTNFDMYFGEAPASAVAAIAMLGLTQVSVALDSVGMTGCTLLQTPSLVFSTALQGRYSVLTLPIPNDPSLTGAVLFAQIALVAPGVNTAGIISSNGGRIEIGT